MQDKEKLRNTIRLHYSQIARKGAGGCCSGACSCGDSLTDIKNSSVKNGYTEEDLTSVPAEANMGLGCGNPVAIAGLKEGETVLDLGCGGGFDCFLARDRVGKTGFVIGVDMTPDMVTLARKNAKKSGYTNVDFRLGEIEHLPVADASVDVIISNCVINLSLDKEQVFKDAYRVLKPGGRLSVSDVAATVELPEQVKNEWIKQDPALLSDCIAGAEYVENIKAMMADAGFKDIRLTPKEKSRDFIKTWVPDKHIEDYVASYIIEAFKI
jgi:ubiquinone/menaquinone biosynthesis C-methylase UbiE